jgi:hypothetical protein
LGGGNNTSVGIFDSALGIDFFQEAGNVVLGLLDAVSVRATGLKRVRDEEGEEPGKSAKEKREERHTKALRAAISVAVRPWRSPTASLSGRLMLMCLEERWV